MPKNGQLQGVWTQSALYTGCGAPRYSLQTGYWPIFCDPVAQTELIVFRTSASYTKASRRTHTIDAHFFWFSFTWRSYSTGLGGYSTLCGDARTSFAKVYNLLLKSAHPWSRRADGGNRRPGNGGTTCSVLRHWRFRPRIWVRTGWPITIMGRQNWLPSRLIVLKHKFAIP